MTESGREVLSITVMNDMISSCLPFMNGVSTKFPKNISLINSVIVLFYSAQSHSLPLEF